MLVYLFHLLFLAGGAAAGYEAHQILENLQLIEASSSDSRFLLVGMMILGGVVGMIIAPFFVKHALRISERAGSDLASTSLNDLAIGAVGLVVGLLIALLFIPSLGQLPRIGGYLQVASTIVFGCIGMFVAISRKEGLYSLLNALPKGSERSIGLARGKRRARGESGVSYKILDTSVIIDGRISDICRTGFIEGVLVAPRFVLEELQHIADSSDALKRNRGRRGLDILKSLQKDHGVVIQITDRDFEDTPEVDSKLIRLAKELDAKIITNDYNLNKVAELQGIRVLNINELANSVKPVVLPGEEMVVQVVKDGKENGQGVAYLDDGTMIVVDGGRRYVGEQIDVLVTSVLQTAAGRMIFAKPKSDEGRRTARHSRYSSNHHSSKMERVL